MDEAKSGRMKHVVLGIDPGRNKTGWAFASCEGELVLSGIVPTEVAGAFLETLDRPVGEWEEKFAAWTRERNFSLSDAKLEYVALGDGTGSHEIASQLERFNLKTVLVNERGTTLAARELYWRIHRPAWWQRCLPHFLRLPRRDVDDLAAWEIVLRSLATPFQRGK